MPRPAGSRNQTGDSFGRALTDAQNRLSALLVQKEQAEETVRRCESGIPKLQAIIDALSSENAHEQDQKMSLVKPDNKEVSNEHSRAAHAAVSS